MSLWKSIRNFTEKAVGAAVGFSVGGPAGAAAGATLVGAVQGDRGVSLAIDAAGGYLGGGTAYDVGSGVVNSASLAAGGAGGYGTGSTIGSLASGVGDSIANAGHSISSALGVGSSAADAAGSAAGSAVDLSGFSGNIAAGQAGFSSAVAPSGFSSYIPSVLGGTGANPSLGSALMAGANLYSGIQGTAAAKANAAAMQDANNKALELQAKNFNQTTANLSPYLNTGNQANAQLATDLGLGSNTSDPNYGSLTAPFTAQDLENTPGYQFQLQQGTQALQRQQSASGGYFSGAALKEGQQFAQGLADSTYNTAYQQYLAKNQQNFGMLNSVAGSGQNAATNQGGFAAGLSSIGTPTLQNTGNITAAGNNAANTAINNSLAGALTGTISTGGGSSSYGGGTNYITASNGQRYVQGPNGQLIPA